MGAMHFVSRSRREGPLGSVFNDDQDNLLEQLPNLMSVLELSPYFHYQSGDCTTYHGYTLHGGPPNSTNKPPGHIFFSYTSATGRVAQATGVASSQRLNDADNLLMPA